MPKIELALPGEPRKTAVHIAETYTITVTRSDGVACTDHEASTTMTMWCMEFLNGKTKRTRQRKAAPAKELDQLSAGEN